MAALVTNRVDFAVVGDLTIIFNGYLLKQDSWREKDKLDVLAMREILAHESGR